MSERRRRGASRAVVAWIGLAAGCASARPESLPPALGLVPSEATPTPEIPPPAVPSDFAAWDAAAPGERHRAILDVAARLPGWEMLRVETFGCGQEWHETAVFVHAATKLEFVLVPKGFAGAADGASWSDAGDGRLEAYLIARTEITRRVFGDASRDAAVPSAERELPAVCVTWTEALQFCSARGLALPTEAQWDLACRAGAHTRFCFGSDVERLDDFAWTDANAGGEPHAVATRLPNALGLFDLHGNVREWCQDASPDGRRRVLRGQTYDGNPWCDRRLLAPDARTPYAGFRPVALVPSASPPVPAAVAR